MVGIKYSKCIYDMHIHSNPHKNVCMLSSAASVELCDLVWHSQTLGLDHMRVDQLQGPDDPSI